MPLTAELAAHQIQERLKSLQGLIHSIDNERRRNEPHLKSVNSNLEKVNHGDRSTIRKLESTIKLRLQETNQEEELIRKALSKIQEIRIIRNGRRMQARNAGNKETIRRAALMKFVQISAQTLPLYVSKPDETKIPHLCGAIPAEHTYIAKPGDMVAALVKGKGLEDEDNWILAEVVMYLQSQGKYEVEDIDQLKERYILSKRYVVPLPLMKANPETDGNALYPKDTLIMALYPQTTCFYKAVVTQLPQTATDEYKVSFEDPCYPEGYSPNFSVPQKYVLAYKTTKKTL